MTNRFKGFNLINRVPKELWTEVHDLVQEAGIKTIAKKNKNQKSKWLSDEALKIAEKRKLKAKEKRKDMPILNAEFQRIARRDKKAFLSDQCKEIEENCRMGKTRDLFKKIRDTKGTFHAKMDTIKDRNGMNLTEANDIKKIWQEYTEGEGEGEVAQSCPTLGNPTDCTVHGILQARLLEWVAFSFSRGSSRLRNRTQVSRIAGRCFTV